MRLLKQVTSFFVIHFKYIYQMIIKAIVFGATGLTGSQVVEQLLEKENIKVVAVVRQRIHNAAPELEQIVIKDFSKLEQHAPELKADAYFCCIGTTINKAGSKDKFLRTDLAIPVTIARLVNATGTRAAGFVSSIGANASSSNFYLSTKGKMEREVEKIIGEKAVFIRPSLLMGNRKEFRFGETLGVGFMKAFGWALIGPLRKYRGVNASDVARELISLTLSKL